MMDDGIFRAIADVQRRAIIRPLTRFHRHFRPELRETVASGHPAICEIEAPLAETDPRSSVSTHFP